MTVAVNKISKNGHVETRCSFSEEYYEQSLDLGSNAMSGNKRFFSEPVTVPARPAGPASPLARAPELGRSIQHTVN